MNGKVLTGYQSTLLQCSEKVAARNLRRDGSARLANAGGMAAANFVEADGGIGPFASPRAVAG